MKLFKSLKISIALLLLVSPLLSIAQYKFEIDPFFSYFRDLKRYEIGGSYVNATGSFNGSSPVYGYNNYYIGDSTVKRNLNSMPGFGASIGLAIPFASTGHISLFAVSVHAMFSQYHFADVNKAYNVDGTYTKVLTPMNSTTNTYSLPIGLDWKVGCDAIESKRLLFGADLGAGVMPQLNTTSLDASVSTPGNTTFGFTPYVKAEGAVFLGMCIRVRAMYSLGNVQLYNSKQIIPGYTDGPFRITNTSNLTLSLIIMPWSTKWHETAWYNDFDSYNWNEKLN